MPNKNLVTESIRHHVLRALERAAATADVCREVSPSLTFRTDGEALLGEWSRPKPGRVVVDRRTFRLYTHDGNAVDPEGVNARAADAVVTAIVEALTR